MSTTNEPTDLGPREQPLEVGFAVAEWLIQDVQGSTTWGTVYRAVHARLGKPVAIKVLAHRASSDQALADGFLDEARRHSQIEVLAAGTLTNGCSYYVMERLEGEAFERFLAQSM